MPSEKGVLYYYLLTKIHSGPCKPSPCPPARCTYGSRGSVSCPLARPWLPLRGPQGAVTRRKLASRENNKSNKYGSRGSDAAREDVTSDRKTCGGLPPGRWSRRHPCCRCRGTRSLGSGFFAGGFLYKVVSDADVSCSLCRQGVAVHVLDVTPCRTSPPKPFLSYASGVKRLM